MSRPSINRIGNRFGGLTVLCVERKGVAVYALCRCKCGNRDWFWISNLLTKQTTRCGLCAYREEQIERAKYARSLFKP